MQGRRGLYRPSKDSMATGEPHVPHFDTLETRSPEEREKALMQALPQQIAYAKANAPFFADGGRMSIRIGDLSRRARRAAGSA